MSNTIHAREQRARYAMRKKGYDFHKSRARNWSYENQCGYMVVDFFIGNALVAGEHYDMSIDDLEDFVRYIYS